MAEIENVTVLRVDGTQAATTLKELKAEIAAYKDALVALGQVEETDAEGKAQQDAIIQKLTADQKLLNEVMGAGKIGTVQEAKAVNAATASYNDMQKALTTLKRAMKDLSAEERDGAVGVEMGNRIRILDARLKELDANMGQFQRNVGNYGQTFAQSLAQAQAGASGLMSGMTGLMGLMTTFGAEAENVSRATELMRIAFVALTMAKGLGDIITKGGAALKAITGLTAATKAQTAATTAMSGAMQADAAATGAATVATNAFSKALIATGIGAIVVLLGTLIANMDKISELFKSVSDETKKGLDDEQKALEKNAEALQRKADLLRAGGEIAEEVLRREVMDLSNLTEQYLDHFDKVYEAYGQFSDKSQEAWDAYKEQQKATGDAFFQLRQQVAGFIGDANTAKAQDGMTALEVKVDNLTRRYKAMKTAIADAISQGLISGTEALKVMGQLNDAVAVLTEQAKKADAKAAAERYAAAKKSAQQLADAAEQANKTELERLDDKYSKELATLNKYHIDATELTIKYQADRQALLDKEVAAREAAAKAEADAAVKAAEEILKALEKEQAEAVDAFKTGAERREKIMDREAEMRKAVNETADIKERERAANAYSIEQASLQARLAELQKFAADAERLGAGEEALKYQQQAADVALEITRNEMAEKKRLRDQDREDAKQSALQTIAATSSILGSIADIYEANGKDDAKAKRKAKNLRIASATIDTLSGAVTAYATAQQLGPILGPIIGSVNAAAVVAAGVANIAKIRKTDTSGNSDSSSLAGAAIVQAPAISPEVDVVRNLTSASEEERLNKMASDQRVYVVESDITQAQQRSRVRVQEAAF